LRVDWEIVACWAVVEREERNSLAVLLERDRERREFGIRRFGGNVERSGLSDETEWAG